MAVDIPRVLELSLRDRKEYEEHFPDFYNKKDLTITEWNFCFNFLRERNVEILKLEEKLREISLFLRYLSSFYPLVNIRLHEYPLFDLFTIQATMRVLKGLLLEVKSNFEDEVYRQIFFSNFKENLNKLWRLSRNMKNENFKEGISLLEDSISNLKSEHIELHQLDALEKVLEIISKTDITDDDLRICDRILFEAEIYTIPPMGKIWEE